MWLCKNTRLLNVSVKNFQSEIESVYLTYFLIVHFISFIHLSTIGVTMKDGVFYGKGVNKIKNEYPEIYEAIVKLDEAVFTGRELDYRTQKLVALGITAARADESATKRQMMSGMNEFNITKDEIVDVLRVVLLTSGMPAFNKGMRILDEIEKQ